LATTNLTASVDPAFVDRADMKVYIGLPCCEARYEILRSCMHELVRVGIIRNVMEEESSSSSLPNPDLLQPYNEATKQTANSKSALLVSLAMKAEGTSGRSLRRLPLQAHALFVRKENVLMDEFLIGLSKAIDSELKAMRQIEADRSAS
jgi:SpoVK/Ycf46/Vps4 family AAA+-type ATPase